MENNFGQAPVSLQEATREIRERAMTEIIADPTNVESLGQFIDQLYILREERETDDRVFNLKLLLEMNTIIAEFYTEATSKNPVWGGEAYDSYYDAAIVAKQMGDEALHDELLAKGKKFLA